ncbi:peptidoglycan-binding domain-containing protein [Agromyces subbeticus]|uniref:peptidoglycan-binding domain-containing protein n=1 Tax=Agromyces subbeticus TaxID=293890 RepID=UPI0003B6B896|nr:peptidoglycan-binding domain-containing protein [Agromyces subbeticus]
MTADEQVPGAAATTRRPRRRAPWLVAGACVAVIGVVATVLVLNRPPASAADDDGIGNAVDAPTETVARGPLTERVRVTGRLAYEAVRDLGTSLGGTVTALPGAGSVIDRGGELFRVDNQPVVLFLGSLPMWRPFTSGMDDGPDVLQLEQNLAALGYFDREPDTEFAASTADAIEEWQEALGLEETGTIEPGRIVFAAGPLRVSGAKAVVGDPAGPAIVTVSGTEKRVTAYLAPNLKEVAVVGAKVQLSLPGRGPTEGTVSAVGAPVEQDDGQGGKKLKLPVTITLDDAASADGLDDVGVTGELTAVKREDALLVPVLALLATSGGGSAVEVVVDGESKVVPIELGAFADGMVEVTGGDLEAGDEVVVAK